MKIYDLKLNHEINPIVEDKNLTFNWKLRKDESQTFEIHQTSYQIVISDEKNVIWSSPDIKSSQTINNQFEDVLLNSERIYFWQVKIRDNRGNLIVSKQQKFFTKACFDEIRFLSSDNESSLPIFTRDFKLNQRIENIDSAVLYISGLGSYDVLINQKDIQHDQDNLVEILNPGWTDYHTQINYQAYDVKSYLESDNDLKIPIGKGYFLGKIAQFSNYEDLFEDNIKRPLLIVKLIISYANGQKQVITTNDIKDWKFYDQYSHVDNDIYNGEIIDFSLKNSKLKSVIEPKVNQKKLQQNLTPSHGAKAYEFLNQKNAPISVNSYQADEVISNVQLELGEVKLNEVQAYQLIAKDNTRLLFDFGQNMAATLLITFKSNTSKPTKVKFKTGEILNDGRGNVEEKTGSDGPKNSLHHRNLISEIGGDAKSEEVFLTTDNQEHTYNAKWTFHGFRYVEVESDNPVTVKSIYQVPVSSLTTKTADLKTNNSQINRLVKNIQFGEQSNYLSIPIDSPNRAERGGWTADAQVFAASGLIGFDSVSFLKNYLRVINQTESGFAYKAIMPMSFFPKLANAQASGWSDIGVILPWKLYKFTGDKRFITMYYDQMDNYMHLIGDLDSEKTNYDDHIFGDWLGYAPASTPFMNLIYRAYTAKLMVMMSQVIGNIENTKAYKNLFSTIKSFIQDKYVLEKDDKFTLLTKTADDVDKSFQGYEFVDNSETGLLWFLKLKLYANEKQKNSAIQVLQQVIENKGQQFRKNMPKKSLSVGFLGINVLLPVLSEVGLDNLAYDLLLSDDNPSWLLAVKNGATTLWERWDSYTKEKGISAEAMNSFNHYSYGSIAQWLYKNLLGIKVDPSKATENIIIAPEIDRSKQYNDQTRITSVDGSFDSVYGLIKVSWFSDGSKLTDLKVTIPVNQSATLRLKKIDAVNLNLISECSNFDYYQIKLTPGSHSFKNNINEKDHTH
ncbi:family 78 glycoside hydrolase catalytic domain [Companilactobacillus halodurans]|uniref:alpha-L-rhamnosidase n=1 Tax=Companilactobacillus halodurans TaxID=2584183 RepID=A0A5P1A118_9LACO|nr:family 78 glycoside hydrolase catalytic domain [Companilactobacillus halodurans]MQS76787.1 hypothetical protein [Companilactobacillus halodurans]MQS98514.1 hypothetical protein [Companilactobacillus halodurans]